MKGPCVSTTPASGAGARPAPQNKNELVSAVMSDSLRPKAPIRRFDVFAEYNRQKALEDGMPPDEAKGYGLWVAKVVAGRRFGGALPAPREPEEQEQEEEGGAPPERRKWRTLGGKPQTDEMFDKEIVQRMGREFYEREFSPAIAEAFRQGRDYTSIRDTLRRQWNTGVFEKYR